MKISEEHKDEYIADICASCKDDPLTFAQVAYPWGTADLSDSQGPRVWQAEMLTLIRDHLQNEKTRCQPLKIAVSSGHGSGKSALISMIIHWALSTCEDTKIVVTANTETQLRTKTWPEVLTWFRRAINDYWFVTTATSVASADSAHERTWRADAIPWSDTNTEGFAGLHNKGKRIVVIMDEASAISDTVWEVTEGALTDENTEIIWLAFGNPTRNSGRFRECFGKYKHRWITKNLDSRTVEGTNKKQLEEWVHDYGEDSDFVRVRVRGEFPRTGTMQFISSELVDEARKREPVATIEDPLVLGVDVARYGSDESILCPRRGNDARSIPWKILQGANTMAVAAAVAELHDQYQFDAIFVDGGGVGGGVIDRLMQLRLPVIEVQFGSVADRGQQKYEGTVVYANKAAEMWGNMRDWLRRGAIPDDPDLAAQLTGREYSYTFRQGKDAIQLEKKTDMKKRGLSSPDRADSLCFEGGTLISTPYGARKISELSPGDIVNTPMGTSKIAVVWKSQTEKMTRVDFSNGAFLRGKPEHNIFVFGDGQRRMDALSLNNAIATESNMQWMKNIRRLFPTMAKNIQFKPLVDTIRAVTNVTEPVFCIAIFGMIILETFRLSMTFTTKTINGGIIALKTWSASMKARTGACTLKNLLTKAYSRLRQSLLYKEPRFGTLLQRASNGIQKMLKNLGKLGQKTNQHALSAALRLVRFLKIETEYGFVQGLAHKNNRIKNTKRPNQTAFNAVKNLFSINTENKNVVPVCVQTDYVQPEIVYNLTLEQDNAYYANGILVYNCLTFAYPVGKSDHSNALRGGGSVKVNYNPLALEYIERDAYKPGN